MDRQSFIPSMPEDPGKDYILRLIEEFGEFVSKVMGAIAQGDHARARKRIESFYRENLGMDAGLIASMSEQDLLRKLSPDGKPDIAKCLNMAKALCLDAELALKSDPDPESGVRAARARYLLAFGLYKEISLREGGSLPGPAQKDLDALEEKIANWRLRD